MASLILSRRDLDFLLYEWLDVESLTTRQRFKEHDRGTFDALLDLSEELATEKFASHRKLNDQREPRFVDGGVEIVPDVKEALDAYAAAGFLGAGMDASVGGMQLPTTVYQACQAWFYAANVATAGYALLTVGAANLINAHGTPEQIDEYVRPMIEGRYTGTMCLSEPHAGSSLADITTRAEPQPDGSYRLFGAKMWISGGEHTMTSNIVHLVLAKIPGGPAGTKGISLFIVPRVLSDGSRNDVVLAGVNHKMGQRGIVNTLLNLGENGGAVGYLVGEPHTGLAQMFHMMNEARVGVGLGAVALGYSGYLHALDYARGRPQGRPVGAPPTSPPVPIIEHTDVRRMLLAAKSYVEGGLALSLYCSRLVDDAHTLADPAAAAQLLDVLTPIAKSWPSQWCLAANDLAIQVLGGYGYTREYDVEQLYRDNRLNPIHEGTHGIQALDLLGRKVSRGGLAALGAAIDATLARAGSGEAATLAASLRGYVDRVGVVTSRLLGTGDPALTLANATAYLEAVGHVVVAWMWLEQFLACEGRTGDFYEGKRQAARFFFRWELPRVGPQLDLLESLDRTTLDMQDRWF